MLAGTGGQLRILANKATGPKPPRPDEIWTAQAAKDAKQDRTTIIFDGKSPDTMVCDTNCVPDCEEDWCCKKTAVVRNVHFFYMRTSAPFPPNPLLCSHALPTLTQRRKRLEQEFSISMEL